MNSKDIRGERIVAALLDNILFSVVSAIAGGIITAINLFQGGEFNLVEEEIIQVLLLPMLVSTVIFAFIYYTVIPYCMNGQTLFKKVFHIKVVNTEYEKAKFYQHAIRNFTFWISAISSLVLFYVPSSFENYEQLVKFMAASYLIGFITTVIQIVIFVTTVASKDGRGLHDKIAQTRAVPSSFDITVQRLAEIENMKSWVEVVDVEKESDPWVEKSDKTKQEELKNDDDDDPWVRR